MDKQNMKEYQTIEEANNRIAEIIEEWKEEVKEIQAKYPTVSGRLDGPRTHEIARLNNKYSKMIFEIAEHFKTVKEK